MIQINSYSCWWNKDFGWEYKLYFCLIAVWYIAKTGLCFAFIQASLNKCTNQCQKKFERILHIHWNLVVINYRARQLHLMIDSVACSFQQKHFVVSLNAFLCNSPRTTRGLYLSFEVWRGTYIKKICVSSFLALKYGCSYPTSWRVLAFWIWLRDCALKKIHTFILHTEIKWFENVSPWIVFDGKRYLWRKRDNPL